MSVLVDLNILLYACLPDVPGHERARTWLTSTLGDPDTTVGRLAAPGEHWEMPESPSLDLTFKEFELLKYLAQHPGRAFTRAQLLQEVWGYDYYGGTPTVDVHVRRLRAKLGTEHDGLVGTVRNVGYRFVPPRKPVPKRAREATPPA